MMAGIDSFTKLMLHMNGVNGSTTYPDASASAHVVTYGGYGPGGISTAQSKFGGASDQYYLNNYRASGNSADWDFGIGDFTIDFWLRSGGVTPNIGIISSANNVASGKGWAVGTSNAGSEIVFRFPGNIATTVYLVGTISLLPVDVWHHVAVVRSGGTVALYIDGTLDVSQSGLSSTSFDSDGVGIVLGRLFTNVSGNALTGYVDELRVSKGIARWTSSFTPPTSEYTTPPDPSQNVLSFIHTRRASPIDKIPSDVLVW